MLDINTKSVRRRLLPGEYAKASIEITNRGELKPIEVSLYCAVKDIDDNIYLFQQENLSIDDRTSIERALKTQEGMSDGIYIFYSEVSYGNITVKGIDTFEIMSKVDAGTLVAQLLEEFSLIW